MTDSRGLVWFVNDHWTVPSFYAYQTGTNTLNSYQGPFVNEDGTSLNITSCQCITEDKDNNMWIGTPAGPFMIESNQLGEANPILTQVKVPRNDGTNYADYLLSGVNIKSIVVDKDNRKWFGTNGNGLYLIAADNITTLAHFTKANTKLLSDNILSLALNDATGELFIGTDQGLCSYSGNISDSSNGMTKDNVWAYPNPVKPDYSGAIIITGLENGASVKIVTSNGVLVNEGVASNGEYKWYGINRDGKRVASGVYMVEVATSEGEKGVVCKILMSLKDGQPYPSHSTIMGQPFIWNIGQINLIALSLWLTRSIVPVLVLMCALKAATAYVIARIAELLFNHRTGLIAILLYIAYPNNWGQSTMLLSEIPSVALALTALYLTLKYNRAKAWIAAGLLFAIATVPRFFIIFSSIANRFLNAMLVSWEAMQPCSLPLALLVIYVQAISLRSPPQCGLTLWKTPMRRAQRWTTVGLLTLKAQHATSLTVRNLRLCNVATSGGSALCNGSATTKLLI